ncbi:uncharacterized protein LOC134275876 [Saccostrea cucullata]|uniref:uncharacterized protein LOC134275876 n=1 Tax=Saccostrea cuccullata TaxID=36930 RepID=UPI002ED3AA06
MERKEENMDVDGPVLRKQDMECNWEKYSCKGPGNMTCQFAHEYSSTQKVHRWNITETTYDLIDHFCKLEKENLKQKFAYIFSEKIQLMIRSHTTTEDEMEVMRIVQSIEEKLSNLWYLEMNSVVSNKLGYSPSLKKLTDSHCLVLTPFSTEERRRRICIVSDSLSSLKNSYETLCHEYMRGNALSIATLSTVSNSREILASKSSSNASANVGNQPSQPTPKSESGQEKCFELLIDRTTIKVYQKSVLDVKADALVNVASERLTHDASVSKAIWDAAGLEYWDECDKILEENSMKLKISKCYESKPGRLSKSFKVILHAVGPIWTDYENKEECLMFLRQTIYNLLKKADLLRVTCIVIPAVDSGPLGIPFELCAESYILETKQFICDYIPIHLKEVHLIATDPSTLKELLAASKKIKTDPLSSSAVALKSGYPQHFGGTDQNAFRYAAQSISTPSSRQQLEFKIGNINVKIYKDSILNVKAGAIVNAANENLSHGAGVALAIYQAAGEEFNKECQRKLKTLNRALHPAEVLETSPGNLKMNFKYILNAVGPRWDLYMDKTQCIFHLNQTVKQILEKADSLKISSIAMPAISSGIFGVPLPLCAEMYLLGIHEFSKQSHFWVREIHIVDHNVNVYNELTAAYDRYQKDPLSIGITSAKSRYPRLMKTLPPPSNREKTENVSSSSRHDFGRSHSSESGYSAKHQEPNTATLTTGDTDREVRNPNSNRHGCLKNLVKLPDKSIGQQAAKVFEIQDVLVVKIHTGSIVKFQGDAIICSNDDGMTGIGPLAKAIATAGGSKYSESYSKIRSKYGYGSIKGKQGDIETCSGGELRVGFVAHAVISSMIRADNYNLKLYGDTLKSIFCTIFNYKKSRKFAMPLIGAGQIEKNSEDLRKCCSTFFQALAEFCQNYQPNYGVKELHLINRNPTVTKSLVDVFECNVSKEANEAVQTPSRHHRSRPGSETALGHDDQTTVNGHHRILNRQNSWSHSKSGGTVADRKELDFRGTGARPKTGRSTSMSEKKSITGAERKDKKPNIQELIAMSSVSMGSYDESEIPGNTTSAGKNEGNLNIIGLGDDSDSNGSSDDDRNEDPGIAAKTATCVICLDNIKNGIKLTCGHEFCKGCLTQSFSQHKQACPVCGKIFGEITGNQPPGKMTVEKERRPLPGYEGFGTIVVKYKFNPGTQGPDHPNPGKPYDGTERRGFLPDNEEGRKVLRLLQTAFDRKLTFTIGYSRTTGKDNVVTWNDIHHKTKRDTGAQRFGYPDPTYLQRVQEELAAKGVTE